MKIYIVGAGGHGKVTYDILKTSNEHEVLGFIDDNITKHSKQFYNLPVVGTLDDLFGKLKNKVEGLFIAIGNNKIRCDLFTKLSKEYDIVNAIHKDAIIAESVSIGKGVFVMAGVIINADTTISDGAIINTGATVDHDCSIEKFAFIAPGANLSGTVSIGERTLIGTGAAIIPNIKIGNDAIVGAGAVVIKDLPDDCIAVGVPAKIKK